MNTTTPRPTPETDAEVGYFDLETAVSADFARKLERERDEALAKLSTVYRWIERNHSDGFIDSQSHLQNLDRVADAWHDKLEDMQRELGKTRDQLNAMREEHDEVRANYVAMCSRLQECVQEHSIGLGGEKLDKLVCDEIKLLTKDLEEERDAWQKEREDAMADYVALATQLNAMREAIKEGHEALDWATINMNPPFAWEPFKKANAALTKLQPFLP